MCIVNVICNVDWWKYTWWIQWALVNKCHCSLTFVLDVFVVTFSSLERILIDLLQRFCYFSSSVFTETNNSFNLIKSNTTEDMNSRPNWQENARQCLDGSSQKQYPHDTYTSYTLNLMHQVNTWIPYNCHSIESIFLCLSKNWNLFGRHCMSSITWIDVCYRKFNIRRRPNIRKVNVYCMYKLENDSYLRLSPFEKANECTRNKQRHSYSAA